MTNSRPVKAGIYSPISLQAIEKIARLPTRNAKLMFAYIVLARYAGMEPVGEHAANQVTGAGAQAVSKILSIQWARANLLVDSLKLHKIIEVAPRGLRVGRSAATFILCDPVEIQIPHAFVDGVKSKNEDCRVPGVGRIFDPKYLDPGDPHAKKVWATALVVLLHCYRLHNLMRWGGVDHQALRQDWLMVKSTPIGRGFKISALRKTNREHHVGPELYAAVMQSLGVAPTDQPAWEGTVKAGLRLLSDSGLIYETVTLLDEKRHPVLPVRINDAYAAMSNSEPSFIERFPGAGFYAHDGNETEEPESVWFTLQRDPIALRYSLTGVTRLRFRCANSETAKGLARDALNLKQLRVELLAADLIDDLSAEEDREAYK